MRLRPCIDIHDGCVKQIVGGSLTDKGGADTNFVSEVDAGFYARLYKERNLKGGHIILLNKYGTPEYEADMEQALIALREYPGGFMIGGGVTDKNALQLLELGASHVIVTSFVFREGRVDYERLDALKALVGRQRLVLDLSCRRKEDGNYYIVTDRWQNFTDEMVTAETLHRLSSYADEYLIHAVDVEGKKGGIDGTLMELLGSFEDIPVTYAGGVGSYEELEKAAELGRGRVDITIGSALKLFGGDMELDVVVDRIAQINREKNINDQ